MQEPWPSEASPIRIVVVEDHGAVRAGLLRLIARREPHLRAVGVARSAAEAVDLVRREHPDVVILDSMLQVEDSLELIPTLNRVGHLGVLVLAAPCDAELRRRARVAGARAACDKQAPAEQLFRAIDAAWPDGTNVMARHDKPEVKT